MKTLDNLRQSCYTIITVREGKQMKTEVDNMTDYQFKKHEKSLKVIAELAKETVNKEENPETYKYLELLIELLK